MWRWMFLLVACVPVAPLVVAERGSGLSNPIWEPHVPTSAAQDVPDAAIQDDETRRKERDQVVLETPFPPIVPDTEWHQDAWWRQDCLRCHETGVGEAPRVLHRSLPGLALQAKCRSCHVLLPGAKPGPKPEPTPEESWYERNAFPPMIPASGSHTSTWLRDDCLLCHEEGLVGAPKIVHEGMPKVLQEAKCRTCHVQVRAVEALRGRR